MVIKKIILFCFALSISLAINSCTEKVSDVYPKVKFINVIDNSSVESLALDSNDNLLVKGSVSGTQLNYIADPSATAKYSIGMVSAI